MALSFALLGTVRATHAGQPLDVGRPQQQAVLSALLLAPGRPVTDRQLIEAVWGEDEEGWPRDPTAALRTHVSRIRRLLADPAAGRDSVLASITGGYRLELAPERIDAHRFESALVEVAARQADDPAEAWRLLGTALDLWTGPALAGVPGAGAERSRARLAERRLSALELRLELGMRLGRHADLLGEAEELAEQYPLRERLHYLRMRVLCGCGRQAEAVAAFQQARQILDEELGLAPGAALTELYQRIRRAERQPAARPRPSQLPSATADFTGRGEELALLLGKLGDVGRCAAPVLVIGGPVGAGKSALGIQAAQLVRGDFPDGQLYADLGASRGGPVAAADVLPAFLRALGADPHGPAELLAARYQEVLADRRVLVLLDDAADAAHAGPLLPRGAGCAALVTCRWDAAGDREGSAAAQRSEVVRLALGPLDLAQGCALVAAIIGAPRADAEPEAVRRLVAACDGLPSAIRSAAARLAARPRWAVAELAGRLTRPDRA
ncbi:AfsR/SARP family transcriptional regulator [Kitasatospora kifunensis]